jgi:DNA-binding response OmpR family regulator
MAGASTRIVVVDADRRIHRLLERVLRPPKFETFLFEDPSAAIIALRDLSPDLIICADRMPWIDGKTFHRIARCAPPLLEVPFLFLASDPDGQREIEAVMGSGDQCLRKPVPVETLLARIQNTTRSPRHRLAGRSFLSGNVDRGGLIGLLKLCEDARLTGRLVFESRDRTLWVDWLAGAPVGRGSAPDSEQDVLDALLDADAGRYAFEPRPVGDRKDGGRPGAAAGGAAADQPIGRFSVLEVGGVRYQVHTECGHSPNFAVSTVVAAFGQGLRKVETRWPHPLKRGADFENARDRIDQQHETALRLVNDGALAPQPRRKVWDVLGGGVEGSQLVWVMSLLRDLARERIGFLPALALLRRSRRELSGNYPALGAFEVDDDGRIRVHSEDQAAARSTLSGWRLPRGAVRAIAAWSIEFREEAAHLAGPPRLPSVKRSTRMIAADLEAVGFYAALAESTSLRAGRSATAARLVQR